MKKCNSCGKCCIKYGHGDLSVSANEIAQWKEYNPTIYRYVNNANIWFDPNTGKQLKACPWLRLSPNKQTYHCDIYEDRPDDCKHYPMTISEMLRDGCEMIEIEDLTKPKRAQNQLDRLMADSRPAMQKP